MNHDSEEIHVAERESEDGHRGWRGVDEHDRGANKGGPEMAETVGKPGQQIQDGVFVSREDIAQVGAVQNVFEGGEDLDPDRRPPF